MEEVLTIPSANHNYAEKLDVKFVYATNGKQVYEFDMHTGKGEYIEAFPHPEQLFTRAFETIPPEKEQLLSVPFYLTGDKTPRYYQEIAVNNAISAIADGEIGMAIQ